MKQWFNKIKESREYNIDNLNYSVIEIKETMKNLHPSKELRNP